MTKLTPTEIAELRKLQADVGGVRPMKLDYVEAIHNTFPLLLDTIAALEGENAALSEHQGRVVEMIARAKRQTAAEIYQAIGVLIAGGAPGEKILDLMSAAMREGK